MEHFCCPICKKSLKIANNSFICKNNHCFDRHKSGYVNLLLPNKMHSKFPGDNKLMVETRNKFLQKDYYLPLKSALCEQVVNLCKGRKNLCLLDAGCGEGYYTSGVYSALAEKNIDAQIFGVDISKTALSYASKRMKNTACEFAVASLFDIPLVEESVDVLFTLFAPYCGEEFSRVIKKGGFMCMVVPAKKHLFELKSVVYEKPYENEVKPYELPFFDFISKKQVSEQVNLTSNEDIRNLFMMTPYYYKTSIEDTKKLEKLNFLQTTIDFEILIYKVKKQ